ncbi:MAG: class I SAM-dependent methyltransferase [Nitrospirota bacterium]
MPPKSSILDIGPGFGYFARICIENGHDYFAIEPSNSLRCYLKSNFGYRLINSWTPPIPIKDNSLDMLFANQILEHMPDYAHVLKFLMEVKRVLRPGGIACFIVPDYMFCGRHFFNCDPTHEYIFTTLRMERLSKDSGLKIIVNRSSALSIKKSWFSPILKFIAKLSLNFFSLSLIVMLFELIKRESLLYKIQKQFMGGILTILQKEDAT